MPLDKNAQRQALRHRSGNEATPRGQNTVPRVPKTSNNRHNMMAISSAQTI